MEVITDIGCDNTVDIGMIEIHTDGMRSILIADIIAIIKLRTDTS